MMCGHDFTELRVCRVCVCMCVFVHLSVSTYVCASLCVCLSVCLTAHSCTTCEMHVCWFRQIGWRMECRSGLWDLHIVLRGTTKKELSLSWIPLELSLRTPGPYSQWLYLYICSLCSPWCCWLLLQCPLVRVSTCAVCFGLRALVDCADDYGSRPVC